MEKIPEILYENEMFKEVQKGQITKIISQFEYQKIKKNDVLFRPKTPVKYLFIVVRGEFLIYDEANEESNQLVAKARKNDIIGEGSIFSKKFHGAFVKAGSDAEIIKIKSKDFLKIVPESPQILINLVRIEAQRMRRALGLEKRKEIPRKIIVHVNYGSPVDSLIALNIAAGLKKYAFKNVAYLHLSHSRYTPFSLLNFKVSENRLIQALKKLRNYKKIDLKTVLFKHKSGLHFLPSSRDKLPIDILEASDLSPLFYAIAEETGCLFVEMGSQALKTPIVLSALRHADQIVFGFVNEAESIQAFLNYIEYFSQKINGFYEKLFIYADRINIAHFFHETNAKKRLPIRKLRTIHKKSEDPQTKKKTRERPLSLKQIIERAKVTHCFNLTGEMFDHSELIYSSQPLVRYNPEHKLSKNFLSLGRILSNRNIGIALGGGGARTISEIGALMVFEEEKISFDHISGTSMGALIAGLFAKGVSAKEIEHIFEEYISDDNAVLDHGFPFFSFFRGKKIERLLKEYFKDTLIEDLPIRLTCVATDLISGQEYHFNHGLLWKAIKASLSLPVVLPPVKHEGRYFIDGAILNNVPGNLLKQAGCRFVFGLNCTPFADQELNRYLNSYNEAHLPEMKKRPFARLIRMLYLANQTIKRPPILAIANRAMMIEGMELMKTKSNDFDYLIDLNVEEYGLFDFHSREELVQAGKEQTRAHIKNIKKVLQFS